MQIVDRIYGTHQITEPVLIELITTPAFERLANIYQAGPSVLMFPWKDISRREHSIGVMLLLRQFGASITDQITGLLHDLPHTALSHVADFVFANEHHQFHELFHEEIVAKSDIPNILKKYHIPDSVIHPHSSTLVEKSAPDLCADRIDYGLRDSFILRPDLHRVRKKIAHLIVHAGEFIFNNVEAALLFSDDYMEQDKTAWAHPREIAFYTITAQALGHALDKKILTMGDMFTDDATVWNILRKSRDPFIQKKLTFLTPSFRIEMVDKSHYHLFIKTKIRAVDPKVLQKGKIKRLSQLVPEYKKRLDHHMEHGKNGWYVDVFVE